MEPPQLHGANQSVTQITVASADNTCMAVGKTVTITARFWCRNTGDYTLVGYASSVPSSGDVTWTQVGTVTACPAGGAFTRTLTTTLSGLGSLQAVRAEIANNPITSACYSTGNRHDADDLVFMVSAAPTSHNLLVDGSVAVSDMPREPCTIRAMGRATPMSCNPLPARAQPTVPRRPLPTPTQAPAPLCSPASRTTTGHAGRHPCHLHTR